MNFAILPLADLEAAEAAIWYDEQRVGLGDDFLDELSRAYLRIRDQPSAHGRVEFYSGDQDIHRCRLMRFPYLVVFRCRFNELLVVSVSHVRRRPLYWLDRLDQ